MSTVLKVIAVRFGGEKNGSVTVDEQPARSTLPPKVYTFSQQAGLLTLLLLDLPGIASGLFHAEFQRSLQQRGLFRIPTGFPFNPVFQQEPEGCEDRYFAYSDFLPEAIKAI